MKENCINCGAPLHYANEQMICICSYCGTEYHLKNVNGISKIKEYEVELEILGKKRKFYISNLESDNINLETYCDFNGKLVYGNNVVKLKIELIEM